MNETYLETIYCSPVEMKIFEYLGIVVSYNCDICNTSFKTYDDNLINVKCDIYDTYYDKCIKCAFIDVCPICKKEN